MTYIKINVGGKVFGTFKSTLLKSEYFKSLFNFNENPDTDNDGNIFIDRSPVYFEHILNYLRDDCFINIEQFKNIKNSLILEAKFYSIDGIIDILENYKFENDIIPYKKTTTIEEYMKDIDGCIYDKGYKNINESIKEINRDNISYLIHKNCVYTTVYKFYIALNEFTNNADAIKIHNIGSKLEANEYSLVCNCNTLMKRSKSPRISSYYKSDILQFDNPYIIPLCNMEYDVDGLYIDAGIYDWKSKNIITIKYDLIYFNNDVRSDLMSRNISIVTKRDKNLLLMNGHLFVK